MQKNKKNKQQPATWLICSTTFSFYKLISLRTFAASMLLNRCSRRTVSAQMNLCVDSKLYKINSFDANHRLSSWLDRLGGTALNFKGKSYYDMKWWGFNLQSESAPPPAPEVLRCAHGCSHRMTHLLTSRRDGWGGWKSPRLWLWQPKGIKEQSAKCQSFHLWQAAPKASVTWSWLL